VAVVAFIGTSWAISRAQSPDTEVQGTQVLTRGPVHEAFAGIVTFNPEPGIVVAKAPPDIIEEVPPGERPEGNNVTWIPGYWAWDDERTDFIWVSGTWRALPPGRTWMAGYWGETTQGYQWTSGYWADATAREITYLPAPPVTVEAGPNIEAPSADYRWTPGSWIWNQERYAWGPGYWARGRADWDWSPSHYVWTPRGYIFVGGYWDYPVNRRGTLFAPVYFDAGVYSRSGYSYSPSIAIDLAIFAEHLFLRPTYRHYYFGDYYAPSYQQGGFFSSYAYQSHRDGYDSVYSRQRWDHRRDRNWETNMESAYQYRRDNESARPPRTWAAQQAINPDTADFKKNRMRVGAPIEQLAKQSDSPLRYQAVAPAERQKLATRSQELKKSRDQRRTLEATAADPTTRTAGEVVKPAKVQLPRSPIVAKSADQLGKGKTPPAALRSPKLNNKILPGAASTARQPEAGKDRVLTDPRQPAATPREKQALPEPRKPTAQPREKQVQPESRKPAAAPREKQVQPESRKPAAVPREKQVQPESRKPAAVPREKQVQPESRKPAAAPREKQVQPESRKPAAAPREKQVQPESRKPAAAPREKQVQPESRKPAAVPREKQVQPPARKPVESKPSPRAVEKPAARESEPGGNGGGQPNENDNKKKGKK
jgi:hypothetical protein